MAASFAPINAMAVVDAASGSGSPTTLNPADKDSHITLSGGNLTAVGTAGWTGLARATDAKSAGKLYWETIFNATTVQSGVGVALGSLSVSTQTFSNAGTGKCGLALGGVGSGLVWVDGSSTITVGGVGGSSISFGSGLTSGTVICVAIDLTAKLIWFRLGASGNWNNAAGRDPATGVGGISIPNVGTTYPTDCFGGADTLISNFGASAFSGAAPAGFSAWSAQAAPAVMAPISAIPVVVVSDGSVKISPVAAQPVVQVSAAYPLAQVQPIPIVYNVPGAGVAPTAAIPVFVTGTVP